MLCCSNKKSLFYSVQSRKKDQAIYKIIFCLLIRYRLESLYGSRNTRDSVDILLCDSKSEPVFACPCQCECLSLKTIFHENVWRIWTHYFKWQNTWAQSNHAHEGKILTWNMDKIQVCIRTWISVKDTLGITKLWVVKEAAIHWSFNLLQFHSFIANRKVIVNTRTPS